MINRLRDLLNIATIQVAFAIFGILIGADELAFGFSFVAFLISALVLVIFLFCDLERA